MTTITLEENESIMSAMFKYYYDRAEYAQIIVLSGCSHELKRQSLNYQPLESFEKQACLVKYICDRPRDLNLIKWFESFCTNVKVVKLFMNNYYKEAIKSAGQFTSFDDIKWLYKHISNAGLVWLALATSDNLESRIQDYNNLQTNTRARLILDENTVYDPRTMIWSMGKYVAPVMFGILNPYLGRILQGAINISCFSYWCRNKKCCGISNELPALNIFIYDDVHELIHTCPRRWKKITKIITNAFNLINNIQNENERKRMWSNMIEQIQVLHNRGVLITPFIFVAAKMGINLRNSITIKQYTYRLIGLSTKRFVPLGDR